MDGEVESVHRFASPLDFRITRTSLHLLNGIARSNDVEIGYWNFFEFNHRYHLTELFLLLVRKLIVVDKLNRQCVFTPMVRDLDEKCFEGILTAGCQGFCGRDCPYPF